MKTSIVPAQITTVEDKIAGKLTIRQLLILLIAGFTDILIFLIFPKALRLTPIKLIIISLNSIIVSLLAYKHQEKILLSWLLLIFSYLKRPRIYIYHKNAKAKRNDPVEIIKAADNQTSLPTKHIKEISESYLHDQVNFLSSSIVNNEKFKVNFINDKKRGLKIYVSEK